MKIEGTIKQLESILDHTRSMAAEADADEIWKEDIAALEFAITALRSMPEAGKPIDSPPAHIDRSKWEPCEFCGECEVGDYEMHPKNGFNFYAGFYKQTAVDEFNEEETEDVRYCPKCGRPLTEEAWAELERRLRMPEPPEEG